MLFATITSLAHDIMCTRAAHKSIATHPSDECLDTLQPSTPSRGMLTGTDHAKADTRLNHRSEELEQIIDQSFPAKSR